MFAAFARSFRRGFPSSLSAWGRSRIIRLRDKGSVDWTGHESRLARDFVTKRFGPAATRSRNS
jgi:hypothetical protein